MVAIVLSVPSPCERPVGRHLLCHSATCPRPIAVSGRSPAEAATSSTTSVTTSDITSASVAAPRMGNCNSRKRVSPAFDRLGTEASFLEYDYMGGPGGFGPGIAGISKQGYGGYGGGGCPQGVNQNTALLATAAAIAVGAGVIFRAITLQQGRRRRREAGEGGQLAGRLLDLLQQGEPVRTRGLWATLSFDTSWRCLYFQ